MYEGNAENKAKKNAYVKGVGKALAQKQFDRESKTSNVARLSKLAGRITSSNSDPKSHEHMVRRGRNKLKKVAMVRPMFGTAMPRVSEQVEYVGTEMQTLSRSTTMTEALKEVAHNSELIRQGE